jgi:peroxiredoxin
MRKIMFPALLAALALTMTLALAADEKKEASGKAQVGQAAPAFSLQDTNGKTVSLSDYSGKIVVLEWVNPDCPYVQRHYNLKTMTSLADKNKDKGVVWLAVATGDTANADKLKGFASEQSISYPILLDSEGAVAKAYGAKSTPHMFIIDKDGKLAYAGGIDDQPVGDAKAPAKEGAVNYVDKALTELENGQPVSTPQTKNYGCGVKYKK